MRKRYWSAAAAILIVFGSVLPVYAEENTEETVEETQAVTGSWKQNSIGWWYDYGDGTYAKDEFLTIKGETYYFRSSGYMVTGWQLIDDDWYYFASSGAMAASKWINGYYLKEDGRMAVNEWVDSNTYVGKDGKVIKDYGKSRWVSGKYGWWYDNGGGTYPINEWKDIDGSRYHFDRNGYMQTGWKLIDDDWYYFASSGAMAASKWVSGYYLKEDGRMAVNEWVDNNSAYVGNDGKVIKDYGKAHWVSGKYGWWYDNGDGTYPANEWKDIDGSRYHFDKNGYMQTGWIQVDGSWYYLAESGGMLTGWINISNTLYYLDQNGVMQTGWLELNGATYYLKDNGAMAKGLQMISGTQYYFSYSTGAMQDFPGYNVVFYSQKDPAWATVKYGSYQFGSTGCGITSIAMALSSVLNSQVLPTDVANYMYNNTGEFNWKCSGNSGMSNLLGAEHWGVNCDIIYSQAEMELALSQGKIIAIMLNPGSFSPSGYTHEMILHNLSDGQTQAYDPLDGLHNGWHSTSQLWSERSTDPYDLNVGTGVFAFY